MTMFFSLKKSVDKHSSVEGFKALFDIAQTFVEQKKIRTLFVITRKVHS